MSRFGLEPTIPVFERVEIFRILDRTATVIGLFFSFSVKIVYLSCDRCVKLKVIFLFEYLSFLLAIQHTVL
jgi:hypothetical protein